MMRRILGGVLVATGLWAGGLSAQLSWDGPPLIGPASPQGLGIFVVRPDPGGKISGLLTWRDDTASFGLGYRLGVGEDATGHAAAYTGMDISGALTNGLEDAAVKVLWWSGFGGSLGPDLTASVPVGVVVGWTGPGESAVFAPYAGGHAVLDLSTRRNNNANIRGAVDLGFDLRLAPGWVASVGTSLGGRDALAVGASLPIGAVR